MICAFTAICAEDAGWIPQYLAEVERLNIPFVLHLDRCPQLAEFFTGHSLCRAVTFQNDPAIEFEERHKQMPLDRVVQGGFHWALAWDIDETFERKTPAKLPVILAEQRHTDCVDIRWLNLWGDRQHLRMDSPFDAGHRVKLLNLQDRRCWTFRSPITNGPKLQGREAQYVHVDLVCLHHGMMTPALRRLHKERWDRIYSTALRGDPNPYGFWKTALETEDRAVLVPNEYLP